MQCPTLSLTIYQLVCLYDGRKINTPALHIEDNANIRIDGTGSFNPLPTWIYTKSKVVYKHDDILYYKGRL